MAERDPEAIKRKAREHHIFGLADKATLEPLIFTHGEGATVSDVDGNQYLDMMGSLTRANSVGYGREEIARAVYNQLVNLHYAGAVAWVAEPTIELAAKLAELAPGNVAAAFFVSGGSESVEAALKMARQYHYYKGQKPRGQKIISRDLAYHGPTAGALSATDWRGQALIADPLVPGHIRIAAPTCYRCPFGLEYPSCDIKCAQQLEKTILQEGPQFVAAFIAEPVMQAHGVQVPPPEYQHLVREICSKYEVLFIADEVITGFGRTGEWFAVNHWDIQPDIMTMAKAMTSGYMPMGAAMATAEVYDAIPDYRHVHTYGGHAGAAAAALANIALYEREHLVARSKELGQYLLDALKPLESSPIVGQVRGLGLWVAIDFTSDKQTRPLFEAAAQLVAAKVRERGILVSPIGTAVEMAPMLTVKREELDQLAKALEEAVHATARELLPA